MYTRLLGGLPPSNAKAAMEALPSVALEDFAAANEASKRYRIKWLQENSWKVYDKYLQAQGIKEGVKNYDRGITLFAMLWREGRADFNGMQAPQSRNRHAGEPETPPDAAHPQEEMLEPAPDSEVIETTETPEKDESAPNTTGVTTSAV